MEQEYAPINHGTLSGVGTTASEAGKGGLKGMLKGGLIFGLIPVALGAAALGGLGLALSAPFGVVALLGGIGAAIGFVPGVFTGYFGGIAGTLFGTVKGATRGVDRVNGERGASEMLSAQVQVAKAQAQGANTNIYIPQASNDNKYGFPMQGAPMNPAMGSVQLDGAQLQGTAAHQQRAVGM